jgi:hypothetical protein
MILKILTWPDGHRVLIAAFLVFTYAASNENAAGLAAEIEADGGFASPSMPIARIQRQ